MTKSQLQIEIVGVANEDPQKKNSLSFWIRFRKDEQTVKIPASQLNEKVLEEAQRLGIDPVGASNEKNEPSSRPALSVANRTPPAPKS